MTNGCLDCTNRHIGCHSDCSVYLEWKSNVTAEHEKIHEIKNQIRIADDFRISGCVAAIKRSRKRT